MPVQKRTSAPDWDDVRAFAAVVRLGSLSAAGRELGLNHATVARRLASLEYSLGAAAVQRTRTGYMPTATGARLIEAARRMEMAAGRLRPIRQPGHVQFDGRRADHLDGSHRHPRSRAAAGRAAPAESRSTSRSRGRRSCLEPGASRSRSRYPLGPSGAWRIGRLPDCRRALRALPCAGLAAYGCGSTGTADRP